MALKFNFSEAISYMRENHPEIKTVKSWFLFSSSGKRHERLPSNPAVFYKKNGSWPEKNGWSVFLGTESISNKNKSGRYIQYDEAKAFCHKLEIRTLTEYREILSRLNITDLPKWPEKFYKNKFNKNQFLSPKFLSLEEFVEVFSKQRINTYLEWQAYSKNSRAERVPSNPFSYYGKTFLEIKLLSDKLIDKKTI